MSNEFFENKELIEENNKKQKLIKLKYELMSLTKILNTKNINTTPLFQILDIVKNVIEDDSNDSEDINDDAPSYEDVPSCELDNDNNELYKTIDVEF